LNTSKQVNVIIGLLMVGAIATLLYYLWDPERQSDATERQMTENAERGGFLFARNCSSCHGLTGKGIEERGGLPGLPLNVPENRPDQAGELAELQQRFGDTIRCGRVGTVMPPWSQSQGGPLNDFQINQLIALITGTMPPQQPPVTQDDILADPNAISEAGWHGALETTNHDTEFLPPKELAEAVDAEDTTLVLNNAAGINEEALLRLDEDPEDGVYELVTVTGVSEDGNEIEVERGVEGSDPLEHPERTHIFNGPALPGTTVTTDTCGQNPPAATPAAGPPVPVTGTVTMNLGDNFFDLNGEQNPTLEVRVGDPITVQMTNTGSAPHNMRTTGDDAEFDSDDDAVSDPDLISGGGTGTINFSFAQPGTYEYQCDFHADQMNGEISVIQ
jgi:plastocyanin/mono/diheme cytochrome c family protein